MKGTTNVPSVYVILRRDDAVAFVRRAYTGYKDGTFALPSGHVEPGESFRQAAVRETKEEVGVVVAPTALRHVYTLQRNEGIDNVRVDVFFEAAEWSGEPYNAEPEKHSELGWLRADDLNQVMDFQAEVLRQMTAGEQYHEAGWEPTPA